MFFIGSTGPLLTFLLTILIPFVLLTSSQKVRINQPIAKRPVVEEIFNFFEYNPNIEIVDDSDINHPYDFHFFKRAVNQLKEKIPERQLFFKQSLFIFNYSGNKAPPKNFI